MHSLQVQQFLDLSGYVAFLHGTVYMELNLIAVVEEKLILKHLLSLFLLHLPL